MPFLTGDTLAGETCYTMRVPGDIYFRAAIRGALLPLQSVYSWEQFGAVTPEESAQAAFDMLAEFFSSDCMIGSIFPCATVDPPINSLVCDGSQYARADYPKLYDVLLPALQVDADTLAVPDLRDRFIVGSGGDLNPLDTGGENEHTLTVGEMPTHDHSTVPHSHSEAGAVSTVINGGLEAPAAAATPAPTVTGAAGVTVNSAGGGGAHNNMPPYYALRFCIVAR